MGSRVFLSIFVYLMTLITNCHLATECIYYLHQPFLSENWFRQHSFNSILTLSSSNIFPTRRCVSTPSISVCHFKWLYNVTDLLILLILVKTLIIISSQEDTLQIWYWICVPSHLCHTARNQDWIWVFHCRACQYCSFRLLGLYSVAIIIKTKHMGIHVKTLLLWLYTLLLGLGRFFSFLIPYTVGRTPWTGDQPVANPLPTYWTTQTQNKLIKCRHPCLEWDSNPRSQRPSERRQFMP
jgi:hypothetical protein